MNYSFWSELRALCVAWLRVDRIRASPDQGRLLRLEPGAILVIGDEQFVVTHRKRHGDTSVKYVCQGRRGFSLLLVPVCAREVRWSYQRQTVTVCADEIEVYRETAARLQD